MAQNPPKREIPHHISLLKAISWRIVGTIDTIVISWFITGKIKYAIGIGSVEVLTKIVLYYLHERGWEWLSKGIRNRE